MSTERVFSFKNIWFTASVGGVLAIAAIAVLIGFVWIPNFQSNKTVTGLWDAICTAAGVPEASSPATLFSTSPVDRPSNVIVTAQMMKPADSLAVERGTKLALQCAMCHGVRGMSQTGSPNLAGQSDATIYKQLHDFKSGHRPSPVMQSFVANLSEQDMRDLAAYYSQFPRVRSITATTPQQLTPVIVSNGAPMRSIGACASCHGNSAGKTATPMLDGAPESYIRTQLQAFATGARRNDINEQMRNVARQMTPDEIEVAVRYYSSR